MKKSLYHIVAALLLCLCIPGGGICQDEQGPGQQPAAGLEARGVMPRTAPYAMGAEADRQLYAQWETAREAARAKDYDRAKSLLKALEGLCLDYGLTSHEPLSASLVKEGRRMASAREYSGAMLMYDSARRISPDYPPVYYAKGWTFLAQDKLKVLIAADSFIEGLSRSSRDFWWSFYYFGNKASSLLFCLAALFSLFGLFMVVRYVPLLAHDVAEKLGKKEMEARLRYIILPAGFLVVLLALGYWWAATVAFLLLWTYFNAREKALAVLFFLMLAAMPVVMGYFTGFVEGPANRLLWVMDDVDKGRVNPEQELYLRDALAKDPSDARAASTLAMFLKKERRYDEAEQVYGRLIADHPQDGMYRNNLGNIHFIRGDYDRAIQEYKAAAEYGPGMFRPHFNLSQAYGEKLMFTEREEADQRAKDLAPGLVSELRERTGDNPLRMVFDEPTPMREFWDMALAAGKGSGALAGLLWSTTVKVLPLGGAAAAGVGFIVLAFATNAFRKRGVYAHFCGKCGRVSCRKCQKPHYSKELCSQCHQIFVKLEGVEARDRLKKTLEIRERDKRQGVLYRVSSLLLPGSGHFLVGRPLRGFFFMGFFVFLVKDIFFGELMEAPYAYSLAVVSPDILIMGALLALFYVITQLDIYRLTVSR